MLLLAVAAAAAAWWQRRTASAPAAAPPPGDAPFAAFTGSSAPLVETPAAPPADPAPTSAWRAPVDGECPEGYPVKATASGIFHVPGGRFHARTTPERCYPDAASAAADGYRPSKA